MMGTIVLAPATLTLGCTTVSTRVKGAHPMSEPFAAEPRPIPFPSAVSTADLGRAEDAKQRTANGLIRVAASIRESAHHGTSAAMTSVSAEVLERAGRYLHDHDVAHVRSELATNVRKRPIEAVLLAAGLGFSAGVVFAGRAGRAGDELGALADAGEEGGAADRLAALARRYGVDELVNYAVAALRGDSPEFRKSGQEFDRSLPSIPENRGTPA